MSKQAPAMDSSEQLAALRQAGAHRFEPVRFHYLEQLSRRAQGQPERVQRILQARLARELQAWNSRREQGARASMQVAEPLATAQAQPSPLRALTHYLGQLGTEPDDHAAARPELRSVRDFRKTWSRLSADRQLKSALDQAPRNAGPINSHMLVLRSLELMRTVSPDYLNRFMSYVDTLLCLEQNGRSAQPGAGAQGAGAAKADKARKTRVRRA